MNMHVSLGEIKRVAEMLAPHCDGDGDLFRDMLEGETSLVELVEKLHQHIAEDSERLAGIDARMADLKARSNRLHDRVGAAKGMIGQLLRAAQLKRLELPEATYSVRDGKPSLRIVDPAAVPEEYTRVKIEPDKTAINEAFRDTEHLPNWLAVEPAKDIVSARTK